MTSGSMGLMFIGVGALLGTITPIVLLLAPFGSQRNTVMAASALLLVGGMALRYAILVGPQIVHTYF